MENRMKNKVLMVESKNRNFILDVDKLFENYSREYIDLICVFENDYNSLLLINLTEKNENGSKGYIIDLIKTPTVIKEYLDMIYEHNIEQIDVYPNSGFINKFLKKYEVDLPLNLV